MIYGEYPKIHTMFKRDMEEPGHPLLLGQWSLPEFAYLAYNAWDFTEKVDGTNIRVEVTTGPPLVVSLGGKTDKAQLPGPLVDCLKDRFLPQLARLEEIFPHGACLYGEGYGPKIQKVGHLYRQDQDFVLFDVRVGDWWLRREDVEEVALKLGLEVVPIRGQGTLWDAVERVQGTFFSVWGDFQAEGIVARPAVDLQTRGGQRIITKIKTRDLRGYGLDT